MANRRREQVGYRKLELPNTLADGLIPSGRQGGELEARVASAFFRLAGHYGAIGDEEAIREGTRQGALAALDGAPDTQTVVYDEQSRAPDVKPGPPSAYDLRPHLTDPGRQPHLDGIEPEFRNRLSSMIQSAPPEIRDQIKLLSGYRSVERQAELWRGALKKYGSPEKARKWVAPPGNSRHNHGRAYDLQYASDAAKQWVHENAGRYGLNFPLGNEPWHIEIDGARGNRPPSPRPGVPLDVQAPGIVATGNVTVSGRPTYRDAGGGEYSEKTVTFPIGDKWYTFPSVDAQGRIMQEDKVREYVEANGPVDPITGETFPSFNSQQEAVNYAKQRSASRMPAKRTGWRPSGGKTLFERAYDAAGIKTYLQMADADMRADQMRVYQAFKDDPVKLREGFDALLKVHLDPKQGHVFPEIEADYRVAFMKNRVGYELQADRDAEQLRIQQDQAEFLQRTNELSTNIAQLQAQITDDNPLAPQMILDTQAQLDSHYDDAVSRKLMTPVAAEKAKIDARREAALGFYSRQADALDADGVKQMRDEMAADFSAGNLPQLDGDGWEELDTHLQAREKQKRAEDKQANAAYQKRADQMLDRIAAGFDVDAETRNQFQLDASTAPDGSAIMNRTLDNLRDARRVRDLPMREAEQLIQQEYEKLTPTSSQEQIDRWNLMSGVFESKRKMLASDPIGYAENNGVIPKTPSVTSIESADDLSALIADRSANAGLIEDHYGVPARYFRPGEAAALQSLVEKQPASILGVADALAGAGPEHAPRMLAEIAKDAPVLSHVAGLLALTGDPTIAVEIGEGMRLTGTDGFKSRLPSAEKRTQVADETWGPALTLKPETRYRAMKAADLLFERRIAAQGLDVSYFGTDGNVAREAYADALNAVLGATERGGVTYGGITTVNGVETIAPPDMPADDLEGLVQNLTGADLITQGPIGKINGITMTVQQLRRAVLVYAGPGRYQMALGDPYSGDPRYVPAGDGGYFELDVAKLTAARPKSDKNYFRRALDVIIPGLQ